MDHIIDAVKSVRANTRDPWRMIVQENCSEDGAAEWLAAQDDLLVTFNRSNLGFSRAINQGVDLSLKNTDSEWTVLMNNDITVPFAWDRIMLRALARKPRVKICSPTLCKTRGRRSPEEYFKKAVRQHGSNAMVQCDWVGFSCVFVHKDAWRRCGRMRFDGEFWHWGSDREFCRRVRAYSRRWRVCTYTGLGVNHWHSASRAYVQRRRAGRRAAHGIVWRLAEEIYSETGSVRAQDVRERLLTLRNTAPSIREIQYVLLLWLDAKRQIRRRGKISQSVDGSLQ